MRDHTVPNTDGPIEGPVAGGAGNDTIFGDPGSVTITPGQTANIVLVLDSSGSMTAQIPFGGSTTTRMQALKDAVNALLDDLGTSGAANIRIAIVDFDTTGRAPQVFDVVVNGNGEATEITAAKGVVNGMSAAGGTNYVESALASAYSWINSTGADAPLANATLNKVMFVSDGEPTAWTTLREVQMEVQSISVDITNAINEMLGSDGSNEPQQIINAGWSTDAIGISLARLRLRRTSMPLFNAMMRISGGDNDTAHILTNTASGVQLAQVSAWSNTVIAIGNLVDATLSGTLSYGVEGGSGMPASTSARSCGSISASARLSTGAATIRRVASNGTPVTSAQFDFLGFGGALKFGHQLYDPLYRWIVGDRKQIVRANDLNDQVIAAAANKFIDYIEFSVASTETAGFIRPGLGGSPDVVAESWVWSRALADRP